MHQEKQDVLVMAAQKGDSRAFEALYLAYNKPLYRFALRLCGNEDVAQEATQDAWFKISKNLSGLLLPGAFKHWVFKTTRWAVLDIVRSRHNSTHNSPIGVTKVKAADEAHCEDSSQSLDTLKCIQRLPLLEREVVHLFYVEDLSIADIARVLNRPSGTIKSQLNRARSALKALLEK